MKTDKLEVFYKTVKLGSLTKAAQALGITQSAVSHIIAGLEEELGFTLLTRTRVGTKLTPNGEKIMPLIEKILIDNEELMQTAADIRGLNGGTVRIGTFTSVAVHWLPGIIKEFKQYYPNVEFKLSNGDYHDVDKWLSEGSVDIGFITLPTSLSCKSITLLEDRLLAVIPPDHELALADSFPLKRMENEQFISLLESSDNDARRALETVGANPEIKYTTKDDYAIIAMVEQGLGVSIMPELLLQGRSERVRVLELSPPVSRTIALAMSENAGLDPAICKFSDYVSAWVKRRYDNNK